MIDMGIDDVSSYDQMLKEVLDDKHLSYVSDYAACKNCSLLDALYALIDIGMNEVVL